MYIAELRKDSIFRGVKIYNCNQMIYYVRTFILFKCLNYLFIMNSLGQSLDYFFNIEKMEPFHFISKYPTFLENDY